MIQAVPRAGGSRGLVVATVIAWSGLVLASCHPRAEETPTEHPPSGGDSNAASTSLRLMVTGSVDPRQLGRIHEVRARDEASELRLVDSDAAAALLHLRGLVALGDVVQSKVRFHSVAGLGFAGGLWWIEGTLDPRDDGALGLSADEDEPLAVGVVQAGVFSETSAEVDVARWGACFEGCLGQRELLHAALSEGSSEHEQCLVECAPEDRADPIATAGDGWEPVPLPTKLGDPSEACEVASAAKLVQESSTMAEHDCAAMRNDCAQAGRIACEQHADADAGLEVVEVFVDHTGSWQGMPRKPWDGHARFSFVVLPSDGGALLSEVVRSADPFACEWDQDSSVASEAWNNETALAGGSAWASIAADYECDEDAPADGPLGTVIEEGLVIQCRDDAGPAGPRCHRAAASGGTITFLRCGGLTVRAVEAELRYYRHAEPTPRLEARRARRDAACDVGDGSDPAG